jgi:hypothetical protein
MPTLPELAEELERYLIGEYLVTPHSTTGEAPQARWGATSIVATAQVPL